MTPFIRKRIKKLLYGSQENRDFLIRWAKKDKDVLKYLMKLRGIDPNDLEGKEK